jgi:hypothetical protein
MNEYDFAKCKNIFTHKCNGEVTNLLSAAERYGVLPEKARVRIESICRQCKYCSLPMTHSRRAQGY